MTYKNIRAGFLGALVALAVMSHGVRGDVPLKDDDVTTAVKLWKEHDNPPRDAETIDLDFKKLMGMPQITAEDGAKHTPVVRFAPVTFRQLYGCIIWSENETVKRAISDHPDDERMKKLENEIKEIRENAAQRLIEVYTKVLSEAGEQRVPTKEEEARLIDVAKQIIMLCGGYSKLKDTIAEWQKIQDGWSEHRTTAMFASVKKKVDELWPEYVKALGPAVELDVRGAVKDIKHWKGKLVVFHHMQLASPWQEADAKGYGLLYKFDGALVLGNFDPAIKRELKDLGEMLPYAAKEIVESGRVIDAVAVVDGTDTTGVYEWLPKEDKFVRTGEIEVPVLRLVGVHTNGFATAVGHGNSLDYTSTVLKLGGYSQ